MDEFKRDAVKLEEERDEALAKLAAMESQAKQLITKACCNAVEKLTELAPNQGWDSGEVVAEMYIRQLSDKPVPADKPAVAVPDDHMHVSEFIDLCKSFSSRTGSIYIGDVEGALSGYLSAVKTFAPSHSQQSAEVDNYEELRLAAYDVLSWIEAKHRPPVDDMCGGMALVRLHALDRLHKAFMSRDSDRCPSHESEQLEPTKNQCDGCSVGDPINDDGNHVSAQNGPYMGCQKSRYDSPTPDSEGE